MNILLFSLNFKYYINKVLQRNILRCVNGDGHLHVFIGIMCLQKIYIDIISSFISYNK